jgi:branched-subunit amino acid aminotransferase/4-amino-4-deoxychorismate lyase
MTQDPKLNSHSKLNCILACIAAEKAGADEALMLDLHGFVNTTNACNFFIVRKGAVWTSTGDYCMNGITRKKVIDLCSDNRGWRARADDKPHSDALQGTDTARNGLNRHQEKGFFQCRANTL